MKRFAKLSVMVVVISLIAVLLVPSQALAIGPGNIFYVNNAPDITQTPIFGQMIDPSGYYNSEANPVKTGGNALDNSRVYIWDSGYPVQPDNPFMMMKWDMGSATNFVRVYPDVEHRFQADGHDYLQWSLWGSNNPGENSASWTLLWDPIASAGSSSNDLVVTQVAGTAVSAAIYRQTNPGVGTTLGAGLGDTFTIDLWLAQSYQYFGIRASTKDTASGGPPYDPEINAVATTTTPPPPLPEMPTILLLGAGLVGLVALGGFVWYRKHRAVVA